MIILTRGYRQTDRPTDIATLHLINGIERPKVSEAHLILDQIRQELEHP